MKDKKQKIEIESVYDVFIAGGGINGIGVARDAAGRGYSVCLCEMNDLPQEHLQTLLSSSMEASDTWSIINFV